MIDINRFFDKSHSRFKSPFNSNGKTIATNGFIVLINPEMPEFADVTCEPMDKMQGIIDRILSHQYRQPLFRPKLQEKLRCPTCGGQGKATATNCQECDGEGEVTLSNRFNDYEWECKSCAGSGEIVTSGGDQSCPRCYGDGKIFRQDEHINWNGMDIASSFAELIINEPDLQIHVDAEKGMFCFKSGEQYGGIMELRIPNKAPLNRYPQR